MAWTNSCTRNTCSRADSREGTGPIIDVVKRKFRTLLACILALALPLQALAMAYVQATASLPEASAPHAHAGHAGTQAGDSTQDPCDDSGDGALKCCHTHAVWLHARVVQVVSAAAPPERRPFVSRWTNYIPEEPSPPPIAPVRSA